MNCNEKIEELVGLCGYADPCFESDAPSGFDQSPSGFFLTDNEDGLPLLQRIDAARIGDRTVWESLKDARKQAVTNLFHDLNTELRKSNDTKMQPFAGLIGSDTAGGIQVVNERFAGVQIECVQTRGAYIEIRRIGLAFDSSSATNIKILRVRNRTEVTELHNFPQAVIAPAMQFFTLEEPVSLPMYNNGCEDLRYWIVAELDENASTYSSKITCCGARPAWMKFAKINGITTDLQAAKQSNAYSYGITIDAVFACKGLDWLCEIGELNGHDLTANVAKLVQLKATSILASSILNTTNINAFTVLGREALYGRRNRVRKKYADGIAWLADSIPASLTDCWRCKSAKTFQKSEILI